MVRNSGKFGKPKRGGSKRFTPARTLAAEAQGDKAGMWDEEKDSDDDDEDEEEESEDESEDEPVPANVPRASTSSGPATATSGPSTAPATAPGGVDKFGNVPEVNMTKREAKKAARFAKEQNGSESESEDGDDDLLNAGRGNSALSKQMKASSLGKPDAKSDAKTTQKVPPASQGMNRKEREELAKKQAREKYLELHRAGKTTEAKADLARLAVIRKERAEAAERKAAEQAEREEAKAKALAASGRGPKR